MRFAPSARAWDSCSTPRRRRWAVRCYLLSRPPENWSPLRRRGREHRKLRPPTGWRARWRWRADTRTRWCPVASELFAIGADVRLILGHLAPGAYTCATPDGRPPSVDGARERVARLVCADAEQLAAEEIDAIAAFLHAEQVRQIVAAVRRVTGRLEGEPPVVLLGAGAFMAREAAEHLGLAVVELPWSAAEREAATAHRMAILAMDQFGLLLSDLIPGAVPYADLAAARAAAARAETPILLPAALLAGDPLPTSWAVTSDSIAAWVAGAGHAARLVLVKAVDGLYRDWPADGDPIARLGVGELAELRAAGLAAGVDEHLPEALRVAGVEAWVIDGREPARLVTLLEHGST